MAFIFLDPITAPFPVRPACRPPSLLMLANLTIFSPAGPMQAIPYPGPKVSIKWPSVMEVVFPNRCEASLNWIPDSSTFRDSHWLDEPRIMTASAPIPLIDSANELEDRESPMKPVWGDLETTANFDVVVRRLPTRGLAQKINGLAGENGSAPGGQ